MRDKHRKKLQGDINKIVRALNKNIYNDNLWLGRFTAKQTDAKYYKFDDGFGGILVVKIKLEDKKNKVSRNIYIDHVSDVRFTTNKIWLGMNNFICDSTIREDVYHNIIDFRK